jgi:hypothetical protein
MPPDYFSWSPEFGASFNTFGQASQPVNNLAGIISPMSSNFVAPGGIGQGNWFTNSAFGQGIGKAASATNNFVNTNLGGWGNALGGLSSLMDVYTGWKSLGLQEEKLDFHKSSFNTMMGRQEKLHENNLRDAYAARAANAKTMGRNFEGQDSWMQKRSFAA